MKSDLAAAPVTAPPLETKPVESEERTRESARPIRGGTLQSILDAEYSRCYRFESISGLVDDLKGLIKRVVGRDDVESESLRSSFPPRQ